MINIHKNIGDQFDEMKEIIVDLNLKYPMGWLLAHKPGSSFFDWAKQFRYTSRKMPTAITRFINERVAAGDAIPSGEVSCYETHPGYAAKYQYSHMSLGFEYVCIDNCTEIVWKHIIPQIKPQLYSLSAFGWCFEEELDIKIPKKAKIVGLYYEGNTCGELSSTFTLDNIIDTYAPRKEG